MARNRVIGKDNAMPWHLPEDLKRFRALTIGHPIIMGRRTWHSLGRALPGRRNLVVSRDTALAAAGCEVFPSLESALDACAGAAQVFAIGGAQIYAAALPRAARLYVTEVDAEFAGDTLFPDIDWHEWRETARESHHCASGRFDYYFVIYERASARA